MEDFNNKKDLLLKQKEEDDKNKQLQVILSNKLKHFNFNKPKTTYSYLSLS